MKASVTRTKPTFKLELDEDEIQVIVSLLAITGGSGINYNMYCKLSDLVDDEIRYKVIGTHGKRVGTVNLAPND